MDKYVFVILHYKDDELTRQCVDSIRNSLGNYPVVVVDNGSGNDSGKRLKEIYENDQDVYVLLSEKNLGFAGGNNLGYEFVRKELPSDFIVISNNDVIFDENFDLDKISQFYQKYHPALIGPDIILKNGDHSSPLRTELMTLEEVNKKIRNKTVFYWYFHFKKYLHLNRLMLLENMFDDRAKKEKQQRKYEEVLEDPVLQGACLIYTKEFIQNEKYAFSPETFMYGEEDLLTLYCKKKGYMTSYFPEVSVLHLEGASTFSSTGTSLEKNIFSYKWMLKGLNILKRKMLSEKMSSIK